MGEDNIYNEGCVTENHTKEMISSAYVQAICGYAGMNLMKFNNDYGMDGCFAYVKKVGNRRIEDGTRLDFQLKSSINVDIEEEYIKYNLEVKNYNDLVDEEVGTPRILIVYKMPQDKYEWIKVNTEKVTLKNCAWWCSLKGKKVSDNNQKKTIYIPKNQIFDEKALITLMNKIRKGETL